MEQKAVCSNTHDCSCPSADCKNHGRCCECVANHMKGGSLPVCMRQIGK
ncbi:MAG: hypothetical protein LBD02_03345 [Christensenellaceae bacterium]|nr:hypothetical protein [Christensenellaceae bacterium]